MTLTIQDCDAHIRHTLRRSPDAVLPTPMLVKQAGNWIVNNHDWQWTLRPVAYLNKRGTITIAGGTWTEATRTLTKAAAFTNYAFLDGDSIRITGGTGATLGYYTVESRTSANAIVLATSIGAAANFNTDIAATFSLPACAAPSDLGEILKIESSVGEVLPCTYPEIVSLRVNSIDSSAPTQHYALAYFGVPPATRLEIYPTPATDEAAALQLVYTADWTYPDSSDDKSDPLPIEEFMEGIFIQVLRAFARGYQEEDSASMAVRLIEIKQSTEWTGAVEADGARRNSFGMLSGGAGKSFISRGRRWHRSDVIVNWPS